MVSDASEKAGLVLRLTLDGRLDTRVNGNGRLPFRFAGADLPSGIAGAPGRIAVVGYARRPATTFDGLSEDLAVAMYQSGAAPTPDARRVYLPLTHR